MGCYHCGRRQVDPDSGPLTWRRAVSGGEQVLVCPGCQAEGWTDALDSCEICGSTQLVKRLGEIECRGCDSPPRKAESRTADGTPSASRDDQSGISRHVGFEDAHDLAAEVATALSRVFRRDG